MKSLGAKIVTLEQFRKLRPKLEGKIVMTSGGYDPIHPGHISCFVESKKLGDILVVVVNGDWFLKHKKGKHFQNLETRSLIVSGIYGVDYVIPFEIEGDIGQAKSLEIVRPHIFAKGGNRVDKEHLPKDEVVALERHGIKIAFDIGMGKSWSSSDFLEQWVAFRTQDPEAIKRVHEFYKLSYSGIKKR
ncbi:MAG TPA: adenylyltransferase/cytidyltransferase family protein [Candidatus Paceibacterota bacterium]